MPTLPQKHQVKFIPDKDELVIHIGDAVAHIPAGNAFDPKAMNVERHCCKLDLVSGCERTDAPCGPGKIEVWM